MADFKWRKAATPDEIACVEKIDRWLDRAVLTKVKVKIKKLKAERRVIIMRCLVRDHRRRQHQ